MKKGVHIRKLNRTSNQRRQLFRHLIAEMGEHGFLVTTEARAKAVKPQFEKLITVAKEDSLTAFRKLVAAVGDVDTAKTLQKLGDLFAKRAGGYTRLIKLGTQSGNNAKVVRMELIEKLILPEIVTGVKKTITSTPTPKKVIKTESQPVPVKKKTPAKGGQAGKTVRKTF
jgi:large subunit ribosomal protein L17